MDKRTDVRPISSGPNVRRCIDNQIFVPMVLRFAHTKAPTWGLGLAYVLINIEFWSQFQGSKEVSFGSPRRVDFLAGNYGNFYSLLAPGKSSSNKKWPWASQM